MGITYTKATAEDIAPIYGLCKELIDRYEDLQTINYPKVMAWVQEKIEGSIEEYTVIYAEGEKAGYYHFYYNADGQWELDDLYVFPKFQNRGIGTAVIEKCCAAADGTVMLYVFIQNRRAVSLYRRLGFVVTDTLGSSRYIMRKYNKL